MLTEADLFRQSRIYRVLRKLAKKAVAAGLTCERFEQTTYERTGLIQNNHHDLSDRYPENCKPQSNVPIGVMPPPNF